MVHPTTLRACAFAGALALAGVAGVHAQGTFQINGRVRIEGGGLDETRVVVMKNGEKQRTLTNGLSKFTLDLEVNADYILSFEKSGFVTKKLSFNTRAPAEAIANGFTPFEFAVSLFKQYEGVNTVVFDQPVGMIRYDQNMDDFDYDTDYTKSIQNALEQSMKEVSAKQEEEKDNGAKNAARAEKEAREKAKAEAERARQKAKEEKAAAEAAEKARKEQEAMAKKEEAERERQAAEAQKLREAQRKEPPPPEPEREVPVARKEVPKKDPPPVTRSAPSGIRATPVTGQESRRSIAAIPGEEEPPVHAAETAENGEQRSDPSGKTPEVSRNEELIIEPNQVITRIELDDGKERIEYRRVVHKYGSIFYFKNGQSISRVIYESEALADNH